MYLSEYTATPGRAGQGWVEFNSCALLFLLWFPHKAKARRRAVSLLRRTDWREGWNSGQARAGRHHWEGWPTWRRPRTGLLPHSQAHCCVPSALAVYRRRQDQLTLEAGRHQSGTKRETQHFNITDDWKTELKLMARSRQIAKDCCAGSNCASPLIAVHPTPEWRSPGCGQDLCLMLSGWLHAINLTNPRSLGS